MRSRSVSRASNSSDVPGVERVADRQSRFHQVRELAQPHRAGHARAALERVQRPPQLPRAGLVARSAAPRAHLRAGLREELRGFLEEDRQHLLVDVVADVRPAGPAAAPGPPVPPRQGGRARAPRARVSAPRDVPAPRVPESVLRAAEPARIRARRRPIPQPARGAVACGAAANSGICGATAPPCSPGAAPRAPAGSRRPAMRRRRRSRCARARARRNRAGRGWRRRAQAAPFPAAAPSPAAASADTARARSPSLRQDGDRPRGGCRTACGSRAPSPPTAPAADRTAAATAPARGWRGASAPRRREGGRDPPAASRRRSRPPRAPAGPPSRRPPQPALRRRERTR